jgi:hypothetical protein
MLHENFNNISSRIATTVQNTRFASKAEKYWQEKANDPELIWIPLDLHVPHKKRSEWHLLALDKQTMSQQYMHVEIGYSSALPDGLFEGPLESIETLDAFELIEEATYLSMDEKIHAYTALMDVFQIDIDALDDLKSKMESIVTECCKQENRQVSTELSERFADVTEALRMLLLGPDDQED